MDLLVRDLAVPMLSRGLFVAERYCDVITELARERNVSSTSLLAAKLSEHAPTFGDHIDGAMDVARAGMVALLDFPDYAPTPTERSLVGLQARLLRTIDYVGQADGSVFVDTPEKVEYVVETMLPAFYLHLASAHAILRSIGAQIGKKDYLGDLDGLYEAPNAA